MNKRHVVEAIALALVLLSIMIVWVNLTLLEKHSYIEDSKPYQEFGIETSADIYVDNMLKGKYTAKGRLITNK